MTPAKKRTLRGKSIKAMGPRAGQPRGQGERVQAAISEEDAECIASEDLVAVPPASFAAAGMALVNHDWQGLIGPAWETACARLVDLVLADTPETVEYGWGNVLAAAGIPWLAWSIMRDDVPWAADLQRAWQRRKAAWLASDLMIQADVGIVTAEHAAGQKLRLIARRWLAERFDPAVYGQKTQQHVTTNENRTIRIEIVDEGPRRT